MARVTTEHLQDGKFIIHHKEDVEPLLEQLKDERNTNTDHWRKNAAKWRKVASIPLTLIEQWLREDGFNAMAPGNENETLKRVQRDYPYLLGVDKI